MIRIARRLHGDAVETLHAWCPRASRRAIAAWLRRERRAARRRLHVVRWTRVGRVWAIDISEPPRAIDGRYRYLVHVRDLASQYHLAALPVPRATAAAVCDLLRALCARVAAPLVVKVDNGGPFRSGVFTAWAAGAATCVLYSPPRCPRYNGSIEASIGAIATRAHHQAAAHGHSDHWTADDVEAARIEGNVARQPASRRTPRDEWRTAPAITLAERRRFQRAYDAHLAALPQRTRRPTQRLAIVHTLDVLGYVSITRRADLVH